MNNKITLRLRQLLTLFVLFAFSITSCQKQETVSPEVANETYTEDSLVKSAIEWYKQNRKNVKKD